MIATVLGAALAAAICAEAVLLSQNTLFYNGNWSTTKRKLEMGVIGADNFLITRTPLSRNQLNLGSWFGFNEVLLKRRPRCEVFRCRLKLDDKAQLSIVFDLAQDGFWGLRLSRDPRYGSAFFESTAEGRFISKSDLGLAPLDGRWHLLLIRFLNGRVLASLDGIEMASQSADTDHARFRGFRAGARKAVVDDVYMEGEGSIFQDSFRNAKHQRRIFLSLAAAFLLMFGLIFLALPLEFENLIILLIISGSLWLCFDSLHWSGVELDVLSRLSKAATYSKRLPYLFEARRHKFFEGLHGLLTDESSVTPRELAQVYSTRRLWSGPIYCSSRSNCEYAPIPKFSIRGHSCRILFVGASQLLGSGAERLEETFFVKVHRQLTEHFAGRIAIESLNVSVSGLTDQDLLRGDRNLGFAPDIVLIGLREGAPPSGLAEWIRNNRLKGIKTVLLKAAYLKESRRAYPKNKAIKVFGGKLGVPVYDLDEFMQHLQSLDSGFLSWDFFHFTSYGQTRVSEWLAPQLIRFIEDASGLKRRIDQGQNHGSARQREQHPQH